MEDSREKEDGHNIPAAKPSKTSKKKRKQQDKGAPRRPLSAYNIFFQEQRALILQQKEAGVTPDDLKETIRISVAQFEQEGHKKPAVGRKRRKPGLFETMARTIADRWKNISGDELAKYTEKAEAERQRYREETAIYHRKLIKKSLAASKMFGAHDSTHAPTDTLVTGVANPSAAGNGYAASSPMPSISPSVAQWNQNTQLGPVGAFSNAQLGFPFLAQVRIGLVHCKHDRFSPQFATAKSAAPGSATTGSRDVSDAADIHATQRFVQWSAVLPRFCSRASPTKRSWLLSPFYHWSDNDVLNRIPSVVSSSFIHADLAARLFRCKWWRCRARVGSTRGGASTSDATASSAAPATASPPSRISTSVPTTAISTPAVTSTRGYERLPPSSLRGRPA